MDSDSQSWWGPPRRNDSSDTDAQLRTEQETKSLQAVTENLRRQNAVLHAQFDHAVSLTQSVDELHQKNPALSAALRASQAEKAEFARRLEITLHANEELSAHLSTERQSNAQEHSRSAAQRDRQLLAQTRRCKAKVEALQLQLKSVQDDSEKAEMAHRMLLSKIEQVVAKASQFFATKFTNIDGVIEILGTPQFPAPPPPAPVPAVQSDSPKYKKALARLKRQRQTIRVARKECESLAGDSTKLQREIGAEEKKHQKEVKAPRGNFPKPNLPPPREFRTIEGSSMICRARTKSFGAKFLGCANSYQLRRKSIRSHNQRRSSSPRSAGSILRRSLTTRLTIGRR